MRNTRRALGTLLVGATALGIMALPAAARDVSNEEWATAVCSSLVDVRTAEEAFVTAHATLDLGSPDEFQTGALANTKAYLGALREARSSLAELNPPEGGNAARGVDRYLRDAIREVRRLARDLRAADPSKPVFEAKASTFEAGLQELGRNLDDPFTRLRDPELIAALDAAPECDGIVTADTA
jgi:hypothetical protein